MKPLDDLPCPKCGYDLRGLGRQSKCPECGIAFSVTEVVEFGDGPAETHIASSVAVTLLTGFLGLIALYSSIQAMKANSRGDFIAAHRYGRRASRWSWITFGAWVAFIAFLILSYFVSNTRGIYRL